MELYKLDYNFKVIKLNIIKETPKTVIYSYPGGIVGNTIRKVELDKTHYSITKIIATSLDSLLELCEKLHQENVNNYKDRIKSEDKYIDMIKNNINQYKKDDTETE